MVLLFVAVCGHAAILKDGTDVSVRLAENVNSNMNFTGETIYFQVVDDVVVGGKTVITKGAFVKGVVHEAVGRKSMGKGGELTLMPKSLQSKNGEIIKFEKNPLSQEGRKRTGATVAHVVMWGPLGLFAKGRAAFMFKDTEFDITVDGDYKLDTVISKGSKTKRTEDFSVYFNEYKSKINYRKGKTGKDFTVMVSGTGDFDAKDVEIVAVDGHDLPKSLKPISYSQDRSNSNQMELTFAFKDIVKYAVPDSSAFVFVAGDKFKSEAQLNTEWKLK